jgi:hypothetical protein
MDSAFRGLRRRRSLDPPDTLVDVATGKITPLGRGQAVPLGLVSR